MIAETVIDDEVCIVSFPSASGLPGGQTPPSNWRGLQPSKYGTEVDFFVSIIHKSQ